MNSFNFFKFIFSFFTNFINFFDTTETQPISVIYNKTYSKYSTKGCLIHQFGESDYVEGFAETIGADEIWYSYFSGYYEGYGILFARKGDMYLEWNMSHCSCYNGCDILEDRPVPEWVTKQELLNRYKYDIKRGKTLPVEQYSIELIMLSLMFPKNKELLPFQKGEIKSIYK